MKDYVYLILTVIISVCVLIPLYYAGSESVKDLEEETEIPGFLQNVRTLLKNRTVICCVFAILNTAAAFFLRLYYQRDLVDILITILLSSVLAVCTWYDLNYKIIPNRTLLVGLAARILILVYQIVKVPADIKYLLATTLIGGAGLLVVGFLCRLVNRQSIGMGDIKLLILIGIFLGVDRSYYTVMSMMVILFFYAVFLLVTKRADRKTELPFAPFSLAGLYLAIFLMGV